MSELPEHFNGVDAHLWVCEPCRMIGSRAEAKAHFIVKGHEVRELTADESAGVREIWRDEQAQRDNLRRHPGFPKE